MNFLLKSVSPGVTSDPCYGGSASPLLTRTHLPLCTCVVQVLCVLLAPSAAFGENLKSGIIESKATRINCIKCVWITLQS